jgi:hypothetical protein
MMDFRIFLAVSATLAVLLLSGCTSNNNGQGYNGNLTGELNMTGLTEVPAGCPYAEIASDKEPYRTNEDVLLFVSFYNDSSRSARIVNYKFKMLVECSGVSASGAEKTYNQTMLLSTGPDGTFVNRMSVGDSGFYNSTYGIPVVAGFNSYTVYPEDKNCNSSRVFTELTVAK